MRLHDPVLSTCRGCKRLTWKVIRTGKVALALYSFGNGAPKTNWLSLMEFRVVLFRDIYIQGKGPAHAAVSWLTFPFATVSNFIIKPVRLCGAALRMTKAMKEKLTVLRNNYPAGK